MRRAVSSARQSGYIFSYIMGCISWAWLCAFGRLLMKPLRAVLRALSQLWQRTAVRLWRAVSEECRRFAGGFALAGERVRAAREQGLVLAALAALALPFAAFRRHKKAVCCVGNILMPILATLVLVFTVQYWSNLSFGLVLEYEGESFGYIADEKVFDNAAAMVNSQVQATEGSSLQVRPPKFTLTVLTDAQVLDENSVRDKIIESSGDEFAEATGVYLNGDLVGALTSSEDVNALLESYLAEWRTNGRTAEFVQAVTTEDGLYPIFTIMSEAGLRRELGSNVQAAQYYTVKKGDTLSRIAAAFNMSLSELQKLNNLGEKDKLSAGQALKITPAIRRLQVRTSELTSFDEAIAYTIRIEKDPNAYEGTRRVTTKGKNGVRRITVQTVYVDGVEKTTTRVDAVTVTEAVEEVVVIGTKKRSNTSAYTPGVTITEGNGIATGNMVWPVPAVHRVYQQFHGGHGGIDISGGTVPMMNTPIVSADGGTVTAVNTDPNVGYGIYVLVEHGNGLSTMYAHLNSVSVTVGQKVSRGQEIGRGGNTGWSTGPHLHFEVRVNGRCVNPLNYVSP